ncbi:MAG: glycoside hydrolase family 43 protein [Spirochaetia bacterium]
MMQRADPWIHRHSDDYYYFTATVPQYDRLELRRAESIEGLREAEAVTIWEAHESGEMGAHIWAPELHYIDGKWYIHFAAGSTDDIWAIRMYVLENESPNPLEGEWVERGQIDTGWESFALDATTFEHRGTRYLVWAQHPTGFDGNTALYIAEMDSPWSITGDAVELTRPEYAWERRLFRVNEGAAVIKNEGTIYMTYSASGTNRHYAMGMLTADENADLLDPESWTKSPEPVFESSEENEVWGPGHNSFTTTREGEDVLVYHARSYREIDGDPLDDPNRHTRVQRFEWNDDGSPDFGVPVPDTRETPGQ